LSKPLSKILLVNCFCSGEDEGICYFPNIYQRATKRKEKLPSTDGSKYRKLPSNKL